MKDMPPAAISNTASEGLGGDLLEGPGCLQDEFDLGAFQGADGEEVFALPGRGH